MGTDCRCGHSTRRSAYNIEESRFIDKGPTKPNMDPLYGFSIAYRAKTATWMRSWMQRHRICPKPRTFRSSRTDHVRHCLTYHDSEGSEASTAYVLGAHTPFGHKILRFSAL